MSFKARDVGSAFQSGTSHEKGTTGCERVLKPDTPDEILNLSGQNVERCFKNVKFGDTALKDC